MFYILQNLYPSILYAGDKKVLYDGLIVYIIISYILGHILHYLSKLVIEPIIKKVYWEGGYYSEIILFHHLKSNEFIEIARTFFDINVRNLTHVINKENISKTEKLVAMKESHFIFKTFNSYAQNEGISKKAEIQNSMYGFFRCMSFTCLISSVIYIIYLLNSSFTLKNCILISIFIGSGFIFGIRAKERGETYVKEIFYGLKAYFSVKTKVKGEFKNE